MIYKATNGIVIRVDKIVAVQAFASAAERWTIEVIFDNKLLFIRHLREADAEREKDLIAELMEGKE